MSDRSTITCFCDIHSDDVAQVFCKYHKKLLCLSCGLEEVKSADCSITEISKITGDQDITLYECLLVRQLAKKKKHFIEEHDNAAAKLEETLNQQVIEQHSKLIKCLDEMKECCLKSINTKAGKATAENKLLKQRFDTIEKEIIENLEKVSIVSVDDRSDIKTKLDDLKTNLSESFPDKETDFEGNFEPNKRLESLFKSEHSLGDVTFIESELYDKIKEPKANRDKTGYGNGDRFTNTNVSKDIDRIEISNLSSDEVVYQKTNNQAIKNKGSQASSVVNTTDKSDGRDVSSTQQNFSIPCRKQKQKNEAASRNADTSEEKKEKKGGILSVLLCRRKSYQLDKQEKAAEVDSKDIDIQVNIANRRTSSVASLKETEQIYEGITFDESEYTQPRYLINKTVTLAGIQNLSASCMFSKLVYLESGCIVILSKSHHVMLLTRTNGEVFIQKTIEGLTNIVAVGKEEIATLAGQQVSTFNVNNKRISLNGCFMVQEDISNITGFDFNETSSQFAISSQEKLVILKKNGTLVDKKPLASKKTYYLQDKIVTAYNFTNDNLYTLNIGNKTLQCFSFAKQRTLWKSKCEGQLYTPRSFCLYNDILCISWGDAIALFSAKDGKPIIKHYTKDLLDDCFGICVVDEVIVFSSNSDDFDTSAKLAFISM